MIKTLAGRRLEAEIAYRGAAQVAWEARLVTDAVVPDKDSEDFSAFTEVANGNGYTTGGITVSNNDTDFDTLLTNSVENYVELQIKDLSWTASGGSIPASGDAPAAVVLVDGNEKVWAYYLIPDGAVEVTIGQTLTFGNPRMQTGGNLSETSTRRRTADEDIVFGNGSFGTAVTIFASTEFDAHEWHVLVETSPLTAADPFDVEIVRDPSGDNEVMYTLHMESINDPVPHGERFTFLVAAGEEVAARGKGSGSTPTANVQLQYAGP